MNPRVLGVGVVVVTALTVASACRGADSGYAPAKGGIGGQIGGSFFDFDRTFRESDYSRGASPRFSFAAHFRYAMTTKLRWQVSPGFTWSGYSRHTPPPFTAPRFPDDRDKRNYLALLTPVSAQLQFTHQQGSWLTYAGLGPGAYRILIENQRRYVKDPITFSTHKGIYPGLTGQLGAEKFVGSTGSTSVELTIDSHLVFAQKDDQFPSGFNSNALATEVRIGLNYYFITGSEKKKAPEAAEPPKP